MRRNTREHVSLAWKATAEGRRRGWAGTRGAYLLRATYTRYKRYVGPLQSRRTTMRMQMSQRALIWICVSAISLNNNRRITITCDLRDWIARYITNGGGSAVENLASRVQGAN